MSALPPKADIGSTCQDVRFVPKAEVAGIRSVELIVQLTALSLEIEVQATPNDVAVIVCRR
jgi:hypothetical protein